MAEDGNIGMKCLESLFCMFRAYCSLVSMKFRIPDHFRLTCQNGRHLLVDNNVDFDTPLGGCKKHSIKPVLLILRWGSSQVELCFQSADVVCLEGHMIYLDSTTSPRSKYSLWLPRAQ